MSTGRPQEHLRCVLLVRHGKQKVSEWLEAPVHVDKKSHPGT